jgi:hypothetical protein
MLLEEEQKSCSYGAAKYADSLSESLKMTSVVSTAPIRMELPAKDGSILHSVIAGRATHLLTGDWPYFGRSCGQRSNRALILPPGDYMRPRDRSNIK